ncbi:24885_t:CDS:2, partial [Racocetra persica]
MLPAQMVQMMENSYNNDSVPEIRFPTRYSTYAHTAYTTSTRTSMTSMARSDASYVSEIPDIKLSINEPKYDLPDGISLAWKNVAYKIINPKTKKKQNILTGCTGIVQPGEIMAIMGPSGAGKSTLLDVLAGRKDPKMVSGQILLNGAPGDIKYVSQYVMQDDALMGVLTVRENIQFAADL